MARKFSRRSWWILCERDASARSAGCKTLVWCVVHCMLWVIHTCPGWAQKFFGADSQTGKWFSASELRMLFCGKSTPPSERSLHAGTRFRGLRLRRLCSILMMIGCMKQWLQRALDGPMIACHVLLYLLCALGRKPPKAFNTLPTPPWTTKSTRSGCSMVHCQKVWPECFPLLT